MVIITTLFFVAVFSYLWKKKDKVKAWMTPWRNKEN